VASLADYVAGRLHGVWLEADQDPGELRDQVAAMLGRSPEAVAEEWAIHDYEGFGPVRLSEHESLERVAALAWGIAEHGSAYAHWAAICGGEEAESGTAFEERYLGYWRSVEDYAEHLLADLGYEELLERAVPDGLRPYVSFDYVGYARDLQLGGEITLSEGDGGVYLFTAEPPGARLDGRPVRTSRGSRKLACTEKPSTLYLRRLSHD
jgi:antirestriction protein